MAVNSTVFQYYNVIFASSELTPQTGPVSGSTSVVVTSISGLVVTGEYTAKIGSSGDVVSGSYVGPNSMECLSATTSLTAGKQALFVALNGQQYIEVGTNASFEVYDLNLALSKLTPHSGPINGNTTVVLSLGTGLVNSGEYLVMFGSSNEVVHGSFIDSGQKGAAMR